MRTRQGWATAEFLCGRCPTKFTSTTEREHIARVQLHHAVHRVADTLMPLAGLDEHAALEVAVQMARAMTEGAPRHVRERLDVAAQLPAPRP